MIEIEMRNKTINRKDKGAKSMSKTEAIRAELKKAKNGSPSEVAKKLNARGIKVSAQYVSSIKAADKRRALAGGAQRKPGRPAGSGKAVALAVPQTELKEANALLLQAVDLVLKAGPEQARELLAMAEQMLVRVKEQK